LPGTKLPREGRSHAEIVPGGGATAWGNAALGGPSSFHTSPGAQAQRETSPSRTCNAGNVASFYRHARRLWHPQRNSRRRSDGRGEVQLLGRDFATDGFPLVAPERRGPIDRDAWSRHAGHSAVAS
jgi:hypothetical protein